jgi:RHS repeat-associated protein
LKPSPASAPFIEVTTVSGVWSRSSTNNGIATRYRYDSQGHLAQVSDDLGSTLTYQYDAAGHLVTIDNGRGSVRRFAWSGQSIIAEMEPTGGIVGFGTDPFGRIASIVDPAGGETQYAYDAGDRLLSARAPSGDVVRFEYAREGQLATIWHPSGNATRLQRDVGGRVTMVTQPDGAVFRHAYDKAGKRVMVTDPAGRQLEFAYDPAGRLVSKKLPGVVVKYKYNSDGELIEADDGLLPVKRSVDKNGRITAVNWPRLRLRLALAYDDRGRVSNFTGSAGQKLHYTYDRASRVAGIVLPDGSEIAFAYDSDSRVQEVHFPNGVQGNYIYTADGAIASLAWKDAGDHTLASWIYGRDSRGNVTGVDRGTGAPPLAYGYDADGRLIEEHTGKQPVRYEYLPGGDRAVRQESTISTKYGYEKDRLVTAGDERLDYDQSGNIVGREAKAGVTHYDYDAEGRLTKATTPEGTRVTYAYDALGQLLARHDDLGTVYRLQYGGNLIEEVSPTRTSIAFYVYAPGIDHPLAMVRDGKTYFYQSDGLGSIALLTDAAGKIVARYETDAFGRLLSPLPDVANPFIFAGREYEPALHLYFNRARWYDPALGRFLSPDPFLGRPDNPETFNRYVYALNAPTRYRDPLGLDEIPVDSNGESPGAPLTKSSPPITRASPQLNADQARQAAVAAFDEAYR